MGATLTICGWLVTKSFIQSTWGDGWSSSDNFSNLDICVKSRTVIIKEHSDPSILNGSVEMVSSVGLLSL